MRLATLALIAMALALALMHVAHALCVITLIGPSGNVTISYNYSKMLTIDVWGFHSVNLTKTNTTLCNISYTSYSYAPPGVAYVLVLKVEEGVVNITYSGGLAPLCASPNLPIRQVNQSSLSVRVVSPGIAACSFEEASAFLIVLRVLAIFAALIVSVGLYLMLRGVFTLGR